VHDVLLYQSNEIQMNVIWLLKKSNGKLGLKRIFIKS